MLRGEIRDADTGEPVAARVYLRAIENGERHVVGTSAPSGSAVVYDVRRRPNSFEVHTSVSAHPFEIELPCDARYRLTIDGSADGKNAIPTLRTFV